MAERLGTPGGRHANGRDDVLEAVGDAVQRAAIQAGAQLCLRERRLAQSGLLGQRDDSVQALTDVVKAGEVEPRELDRWDLAGSKPRAERADRQEGDLAVVHKCPVLMTGRMRTGSSAFVSGKRCRASASLV
jgi:hypothetical protein